jgi:DNA primase
MIQDRGISVETAVKWNVGYFPGKGSMEGRIVFPLYEDGHLIGYAGRTTLEVTDANPKWKLPAGLHKTFLYGLERCDPKRTLRLVESPWTVLQMEETGYQAASLLGSSMTPEQEKRLDPFRTIVVEMDDDPAGREANEAIAARLKRDGRLIYRSLWKG